MFRSRTMGYYQVILPHESAWEILNELGELDCLHFVDHDPLKPALNRPHAG